jgi:hypothetical protein
MERVDQEFGMRGDEKNDGHDCHNHAEFPLLDDLADDRFAAVQNTVLCLPSALVQMVADYSKACSLCYEVTSKLLEKEYWTVPVRKNYNYNDLLEISIHVKEGHVSILYSGESGIDRFEYESECECSIHALAMVISHRLSLYDLISGDATFDVSDPRLHQPRHLSFDENRWAEHEEHAGLELRRNLLGADSEDENDSKEARLFQYLV